MADWIAQPTWAAGETVASVKLGKHSQGITHVKERWDRAVHLTGATDAAVGDLLVLDPSVTDGVALATTEGQAGPILVALEALDAGGLAGQARAGGFVTLNISGDVAKGDLVRVSSTGLGERAPLPAQAFAVATSGDTAPGQVSVLLFPAGQSGTGGGGAPAGSGGAAAIFGSNLFVPPAAADFTLINAQTGGGDLLSTLADVNGGTTLWATGHTSEELRIARQTAVLPSTPWTVTAFFNVTTRLNEWWAFGLCLENTSGGGTGAGQVLRFMIYYDASNRQLRMKADQVTSPTNGTVIHTFTSDFYCTPGMAPPLWLRLYHDGSDIHGYLSRDGSLFAEFTGSALTTAAGSIAANHAGFFGDGGAQGFTGHVAVHCLSFEVA